MSNTLFILKYLYAVYINIRTVLFQVGFPCNAFVLELLHCFLSPLLPCHCPHGRTACPELPPTLQRWALTCSGFTLIKGGREPAQNILSSYKRCNFEVCCWMLFTLKSRSGGSESPSSLPEEKIAIAFPAPQCIPSKQTNKKKPLPVRRFLSVKQSPTPETSPRDGWKKKKMIISMLTKKNCT